MNFKYILLTSIALICSNSFAQIDPHFWRLKTPSINGRIQNTLPEVVIKSLEFNVFFDHGSRVSSWLPWS